MELTIIIFVLIWIIIFVCLSKILSKSANKCEKEMDKLFERTKEDMEKYANKVFKANEAKRKENLKKFESIKNKVSNEDIRMMLEEKGLKTGQNVGKKFDKIIKV